MNMNKDQIDGRAKEVAGTAKEVTGKVIGSDKLELKGKVEKSSGAIQATVGDFKKDVKDAVKPD
jgi:uncharacterized protein YjbJ (UPF0337 family)